MTDAVRTPRTRVGATLRRLDHAAAAALDRAGDATVGFLCRVLRVDGTELWIKAMALTMGLLLLLPVALVAILLYALGRAAH